MLVSAEIRWFWEKAPAGLEDWFRSAHGSDYGSAGGGDPRVDDYLLEPGQVALGIKRRGGKPGVEIKGLVSVTWGGLAVSPFVGPIELWVKWTSEPLELKAGSTIAVTKKRWLRKFDTSGPAPREVPLDKKPLPALGCNVELTQVSLPGRDVWWTFGFEAFGTTRTVENDLRSVTTVLAARRPPALEGGLLASYPTWLSKHVRPA